MGSHVVDVGGAMMKKRLNKDGGILETEDLFKDHEAQANVQQVKAQLDA